MLIFFPYKKNNFLNSFRSLYSSRKSSTTHSYQCVLYFCVSKQQHGCQCLELLMCAQRLMHVNAHGGCTDAVREAALKVD